MALIEGRTDDGKVVAMWAPGRTPQPGLAWAIRIKPNDVTFHDFVSVEQQEIPGVLALVGASAQREAPRFAA